MPAFNDYYRALGHDLVDLWEYSASGGSTTSVTLPDISTSATNQSAEAWNGAYAYNSVTQQARRVKGSGYTPATGALAIVGQNWTAPVLNNRIVLSRRFPVVENTLDTATSYRTIANRTLELILVKRRLAWTIVPGQPWYSIAAYRAWLDREDRVGWAQPPLPDGSPRPKARLLEPGPVSGANPIPADWRDPVLRLDGVNPYLEIHAPFASGTTGQVYLNVMSPAVNYINTLETTTGLVGDADETTVPVADFLKVAKMIVYEELMVRGATSATGAGWREKWLAQREIARGVQGYDQSSERTPVSLQPTAAAGAS
jgi:hypothetical protein